MEEIIKAFPANYLLSFTRETFRELPVASFREFAGKCRPPSFWLLDRWIETHPEKPLTLFNNR